MEIPVFKARLDHMSIITPMKKVLKAAGVLYICISALFFSGYLVLYVVDGWTYVEICETHKVMGHAVRLTADGLMQTVLVGEMARRDGCSDEVPIHYGEVYVDDAEKYPVGTEVTYSCRKSKIREERGFGRLISAHFCENRTDDMKSREGTRIGPESTRPLKMDKKPAGSGGE